MQPQVFACAGISSNKGFVGSGRQKMVSIAKSVDSHRESVNDHVNGGIPSARKASLAVNAPGVDD